MRARTRGFSPGSGRGAESLGTPLFSPPSAGHKPRGERSATRAVFQVRKKNSLKDFVAVAGPLGVTHFLVFTKSPTNVSFVSGAMGAGGGALSPPAPCLVRLEQLPGFSKGRALPMARKGLTGAFADCLSLFVPATTFPYSPVQSTEPALHRAGPSFPWGLLWRMQLMKQILLSALCDFSSKVNALMHPSRWAEREEQTWQPAQHRAWHCPGGQVLTVPSPDSCVSLPQKLLRLPGGPTLTFKVTQVGAGHVGPGVRSCPRPLVWD